MSATWQKPFIVKTTANIPNEVRIYIFIFKFSTEEAVIYTRFYYF